MITMNKFLTALERWFETLAQARVNAHLMTLGLDPWRLQVIPARRYAEPGLTKPGSERTKKVRTDCTIAGHTRAATNGAGPAQFPADPGGGDFDTPRRTA